MKLPPLNALRAFETAARTGTFTRAGEELNVSSAAVSQQVRKLEAYLDRKLFFRNNNHLLLTDAGRDLYMNAAASLTQISEFTEKLLAPKGPSALVISAAPSLAERWLPGILARYRAAPVELRIEDDPPELESRNIDLRLTYGDDGYAGFWSRPLFQDELTPMAAPQFATNWDKTPPDMAATRLIHMDWGPSFSRIPSWSDWFGRDIPNTSGVRVPGGTSALALAECGAGVALGQLALANRALAEGRLVRLSRNTLMMSAPYKVISAHARLKSNRIQAFLEILPPTAAT